MDRPVGSPAFSRPGLVIALAAACLAGPTMFDVARDSWSSEQGAHGPIVLLTGIWLLVRELRAAKPRPRPGNAVLTALLLLPLLIVYTLARISGIIEIEGFTMYAALIVAAYGIWGGTVLRAVWFPLVYMLFVFPPPDTLFAMLTQPLKILISQTAVTMLHGLGYPIAGSGVMIQIGQYQMLVAAACAGLNSLLSLTALGMFYTYIRHSSNFAYMLVLICFILPIAIVANLVRVLLLLLITYHFGEAAGQGFFHELAGLSMFASALLSIFVLDWLGTPLRRRLAAKGRVQ
ncbi:exosortase [Sphingomonas sp. Leaf357]|uniref:exosortase V n=1 Tax=Sphingomonas sp. Leaf357 TaxID=1736350 RepID=UPI0006F1D0D5|nr:exosortase V [Sphingomonas sp. Leaf357]KQS04171.1 exosortase [Sphingomonas sp. Leaf357]